MSNKHIHKTMLFLFSNIVIQKTKRMLSVLKRLWEATVVCWNSILHSIWIDSSAVTKTGLILNFFEYKYLKIKTIQIIQLQCFAKERTLELNVSNFCLFKSEVLSFFKRAWLKLKTKFCFPRYNSNYFKW